MTLTAQDRENLVDGVKFYALKLAKQFYKKQHPLFDFEDVIQAAMLGATEAARKYDDTHESKASFMTYAASPMLNRVITLYRTSTPAHIPRREYDAMAQPDRGRNIWASHVTLSDPAFRSSDNQDTTLADMLPDDTTPNQSEVFMGEDRRAQVREIVGCLPDKERFIVSAAFGLNGFSEVRLSEIASFHGVSRQRVHQQLTSALKKLERMAVSRGLSV